jgi:hypothetical protein
MQSDQQVFLVRRIQVRSATKMNPVMGGSGCQGITATQTANSNLPDIHSPQIPNRRPFITAPLNPPYLNAMKKAFILKLLGLGLRSNA